MSSDSAKSRLGAAGTEAASRALDSFFDLSLDLLCIAGFDGLLKRINPAFERTLGYREEELLARPLAELIHPDDRAATLAEGRRLRIGGQSVCFENRCLAGDGSYKWLLWNSTADRERQLIYATARDVTTRHDEESAAARVTPYRSLLGVKATIVWTTTGNGEFATEQREWGAFTGQSWRDMKGWGWLNAVHPQDQPATAAAWSAAVEGRGVYQVEHRVRRQDGEYRDLTVQAVPIVDRDGSIREWIGVHTDITDSKQNEQATQRAERFLTSVVDNIPTMVFVKDARELRFVRVNKAEEEMMHLPQSEILGKSDYDFFPAEEADFFTSKDRAVLAGRHLIDIPEETVHTGHGVRIFHTKKIPILDDGGQPQYLLGISEDITEAKHAEAEMREAQEAIVQSREELRAHNALMQADLDLARAMQEAFILREDPALPQTLGPHRAELCFHHRYIPAAMLGGDFFNVLPLSDTCAGVFICDVMGHGVRAALVTAMIRALVGEKNSLANEPGEFLAGLNQHLHRILEQARITMFASAFYLVADTATGRISYANAGHPSPLRVRRGAGTAERLVPPGSPSGPALGVFTDAVYEPAQGDLDADDLFMLFTDGMFEVHNASGEYGEQRLLAATRQRARLPVGTLFDELLGDIRHFSANGEFEDDVCLVGINVAQ